LREKVASPKGETDEGTSAALFHVNR
jgi:hypothetical protein